MSFCLVQDRTMNDTQAQARYVLVSPRRGRQAEWVLRTLTNRRTVWIFNTHQGAVRVADFYKATVMPVADVFN